jgi:rhodanese-related sulfurtransferase
MRKLVVLSCLALAGSACAPARDDAGADRRADRPRGPAQPEIAQVTVDELDHMLAGHQCVAVDANGDATRRRMGVIPGAVLLTDDAIDKLPADKSQSLVFYCANEACRSSHEAATRAFLAGYTHVKVMPAGIAGWVRAGKQTSSM